MKTNYQKQATDFLTKTGTTFKTEFIKNDYHFVGDTEKRDIYKITLSRGQRVYSFNFGQSINNSGIKIRLRTSGRITQSYAILPEFMTKGKFDIVKFKRWYHSTKYQLANIDEVMEGIAPSEYDVLTCITKYNPDTFENFCYEFGYDTDSKKAEKTYNAVCDEYKNVCALFSDTELSELQEIN